MRLGVLRLFAGRKLMAAVLTCPCFLPDLFNAIWALLAGRSQQSQRSTGEQRGEQQRKKKPTCSISSAVISGGRNYESSRQPNKKHQHENFHMIFSYGYELSLQLVPSTILRYHKTVT
jgi:hypothetical protein